MDQPKLTTDSRPLRSPKLVYLAGPIAACGRDAAIAAHREIGLVVMQAGFTAFDPAGAWLADPHWPAAVVGVQVWDDVLLAQSAGMLVVMTGFRSAGTKHEVRLARQLGLPIAVYQHPDCPQRSAVFSWEDLFGDQPDWPGLRGVTTIHSMEELHAWLGSL